ncbi:MAG: hypothetical protein QOG46_663, partial [Pseudonocardiales bacterium]|nr:hypothetical protein [Pseudonocardiales bacterium]
MELERVLFEPPALRICHRLSY